MAVSDPYVIGAERPQRQDSAFERAYGNDVKMSPDGFAMAANDDLALIAGIDALRANFFRALVTAPGEIFWRPTYGIDLVAFKGQKVTAAALEEKKAQIRDYLLREPLVERVDPLTITVSTATPSLVEIDVGVVVAGVATRWRADI